MAGIATEAGLFNSTDPALLSEDVFAVTETRLIMDPWRLKWVVSKVAQR